MCSWERRSPLSPKCSLCEASPTMSTSSTIKCHTHKRTHISHCRSHSPPSRSRLFASIAQLRPGQLRSLVCRRRCRGGGSSGLPVLRGAAVLSLKNEREREIDRESESYHHHHTTPLLIVLNVTCVKVSEHVNQVVESWLLRVTKFQTGRGICTTRHSHNKDAAAGAS